MSSNSNSGSGKKLDVIDRDLYAVMYMLPDPASRCLITVPVARGKAKEAVDVVRKLSDLLSKYDCEVGTYLPVRRSGKPGEVRIVKSGRSREFRIEIVAAPRSIINVVEQVRYDFRSWLGANGIVVRMKPANLYMLTDEGLKGFYTIVDRARKGKLAKASEALAKVWSRMIDEIERLVAPIADAEWSGISKEAPDLSDVKIIVTQLRFRAMLESFVEIPSIRDTVLSSVRGMIEEMIQSLFEEAMNRLSKAAAPQQAADALRVVASKARRFGLHEVASELESISSILLGEKRVERAIEMLRQSAEKMIRSVGAEIASLRL